MPKELANYASIAYSKHMTTKQLTPSEIATLKILAVGTEFPGEGIIDLLGVPVDREALASLVEKGLVEITEEDGREWFISLYV